MLTIVLERASKMNERVSSKCFFVAVVAMTIVGMYHHSLYPNYSFEQNSFIVFYHGRI